MILNTQHLTLNTVFMAKKYELDIRDYARILRKRKGIVIFTTLMLGVFSFVFATMQKPVPLYKASSSVKIEKSSTMAGLYLESLTYSEWDTLETQATIIRSYPIMEIVAKRLEILDKDLPSDEIRQNNQYLDIVLDLKDQVTTVQEGNTNIINITVTSEDPEFCQRAANTIAEVFREQNTYEKNKRAISARKFISDQLNVVGQKLKDAEEKVKMFREENKLVSIDRQSGIILDQLTRSEAQYVELTKSLSEMELMARQLREQKAIPKGTLEGVVSERVGPVFQRLNTQLLDLNVKKDSLLLIYTDKHPEVMDVNEQISNVTKNMLSQLIAQKDTLQRSSDSLKIEIEKFKEQLKALPESGLELARLERDVKLNGEVYVLLEQKHQEALIKEAEKIEEVSIVKPALKPNTAINPPQTASITFVGTILGLVLGLVFAFVMETMDTSIGTIEDVEDYLGVPVVGIIPYIGLEDIKEILLKKSHIEQADEILERNARLVTHFAPKSTMAESYRALRTNIQFSCLEKEAKLIMFTSSSPGEGKSSTTMNLAMVMAQTGSKILLVDADMRKPMVNKVFGLDREPGLSDVILGNYELDDVVRTVTDIMMGKMGMEDIMTTPGIDNLSIITSGTIPPNPSELLTSPKIPALLAQLKERYDVILIDCTPILPATDAAILGAKVDGVVIVYQVGKIARGSLKRAKVQMDNVKAKVLGVVLNGLKPEVSLDYHDYRYESYYAYGAEHAEPKKKSWIPLPGFIKKLIPQKESKKGQGARGKGQKEKSGVAAAFKMLTMFAAVSFMLVGIFYNPPTPPSLLFNKEGEKVGVQKAEEKEEKKAVPIAAITGTPPSALVEEGKPETPPVPELPPSPPVGIEGGGWFSKINLFISAIVISLMAVVALISVYLIRKKRTGDTGKKEDISPAPEAKTFEAESAPSIDFSEEAKTEASEELTAGGALFGEGGVSEKSKTKEAVSSPETEKLFEPAPEMPASAAGEPLQPLDFPIDLNFESGSAAEELLEEAVPEAVLVAGIEEPVVSPEEEGVLEGRTFEEAPVESAILPLDIPMEEASLETVEGLEITEPEDVLEGTVIESEAGGAVETAASELQTAPAGLGDGGSARQAHDVDVKETLIDSSFKGFITEDDTHHFKEEAVDFSDLEKGDAFKDFAIPAEDDAPSSAVKDLDITVGSVITDLSVPSEDSITGAGGVKEEDIREEIEGDIINGVELKEDNFSSGIVLEEPKSEKERKPPDDQIKEWEKLLLID